MDSQPSVAPPQSQAPLACRICACELEDRHALSEHHKTLWHLYNMRRRSQQLPSIPEAEFNRKTELLRLARQYAEGCGSLGTSQHMTVQEQGLTGAAADFHAAVRCNIKGKDHIKKHQDHQRSERGVTTSALRGSSRQKATAKAAAAAWRAALLQHPERCNLFEQMPAFPSAAENLSYMRKTYGFFVPDEEYCVNLAGLLRCLWQEQQKQPRCLFCCRGFKGIRAALQHMQQQRHFQLKWDEEQQDLLHRFYDYKKSYYEILGRLPEVNNAQLVLPDNLSSSIQDATSPLAAAKRTGRPLEAEAEVVAGEDEGDWEDCSSDEEGSANAASEQRRLEEMLQARGWRHARVTDEGNLQLPSGQEVLHRSHAIFCRQRVRRVERQAAEQCVLRDMARGPFLPDVSTISKWSVALYKRHKLHKQLKVSRGDTHIRQEQRVMLAPQQRRLIWKREAEQQRRMQQQRVKLGIMANILNRTILRDTKCFL
ncbi:hypothetical protein, conserved [Eimeria tenella]|uniref:ZN622/Rei1/Reh1 zinc finger C2H2-type domain-containing protein n=1 Tax=Eimeria tenella TaxID=5802 RepID=U6KGA6_EIMTE|nr:hypothetical protein, conserved [Eimeria tenella]CDJ36964.1 hypothetical protein, conserved [Eimeria tenella]|eukprot:XP_013227802.1 hypothetical protein, conserved [Eimeria tenella]